MSIDIDTLLQEISPDAPCGEDISYDPAYLELERLAQGTPETQFSEGEEANWGDIGSRCLELLKRSKNLRLGVFLALSLLHQEGVSGLRDGLAFLRGLLEGYWDNVYPQLDPEDNNDPLERMNIVASLSPPSESFQDPMKFKEQLMVAPLCSSRQMGTFGLRHILVASGEVHLPEGSGEEVQQMSVIHAAFDDTPIEDLQATHQAVLESIDHVKAIEAFLLDKVGAGAIPNLDDFQDVLKHIDKQLQEVLSRRGYGSEDTAADQDEATGSVVAPASGTVNSKEDVLRCIDKICAFYESHEPSSPVPLLLKRAKRLVGKSFMDIIRDVSPDAMSQIESLSGGSQDFNEGSE